MFEQYNFVSKKRLFKNHMKGHMLKMIIIQKLSKDLKKVKKY